jgi:hypothetical protein
LKSRALESGEWRPRTAIPGIRRKSLAVGSCMEVSKYRILFYSWFF